MLAGTLGANAKAAMAEKTAAIIAGAEACGRVLLCTHGAEAPRKGRSRTSLAARAKRALNRLELKRDRSCTRRSGWLGRRWRGWTL
eukprot:5685603-Prymnesium_polylepis.2